ncbi:uncharacterized protein LOC114448131 [Parambassis ranga]|uniref:Uncharacterized protein LOC114448131 n=1 Tax=Parambassis ranga TaxID=210632 RepID=A0A6P7JUS4_9TELE|nr:uncharacterized protein LOC114448131 [Parambassis ranga]
MCLKLLRLLHLLVAALTSVTPLDDHTGQRFIMVYPESIAYYHPTPPDIFVYITALYDSTTVTFKQYNYSTDTTVMEAGQSRKFTFDARMELGKTETSEKILEIQSNRSIAVQAIGLKHNSAHSAVVIPADKLSTRYFIPPVPKIEGTTDPESLVTMNVTERSPFRLIIVNDNQPNTVTLEGGSSRTLSIQPRQVRQVWIEDRSAWRAVTAVKPVAVIFGHPCAVRQNCTCGALYNMLPAAGEQELKFLIPRGVAEEGKASVLLSEKNSSNIKDFKLDSPVIKVAGTATLYRPGLLLTLIPETDFAACYAVPDHPDTETFAIIVVHKDFKADVRFGSAPLSNAQWEELKGTDYVSARIDLQPNKNIIWHPSTTMAVYFGGTKDGGLFGNPAAVISKSPDIRGCAVVPEVIKIGEVADGWRESLKYCRDNNLMMVTLPDPGLRQQIYQRVAQRSSVKELWIGMRRSSFTGEWYWVDGQGVNNTDWGEREPGAADEGQCARMTVKNMDFDWEDEDCCKDIQPVCYDKPYILPLNQ